MRRELEFLKKEERECNLNIDDLYTLHCTKLSANNIVGLGIIDDETLIEMAIYVNTVYYKDENGFAIGKISDVVVENWEEIKKEDIGIRNFVSKYFNELEVY